MADKKFTINHGLEDVSIFKFTNGAFTMLNKILLCLVAAIFISPAYAEIRKWKDENGKTHYGDAPSMAGAERVKSDKQTDDQIANGAKIRAETEKSVRDETAKEAMQEALASAKNSGKCDFSYHAYADEKGKQLAKAARDECYNNEAFKKTGQSDKTILDAYNAWKDHFQMTSTRRNAAISNSQNAAAQRESVSAQRKNTEALDKLNNSVDKIERRQRYSY